MNIYGLQPVNKTAAIVTSQSGCEDNFENTVKQELKVLGERKQELMRICNNLKSEIGIDAREGSGSRTRYPPKILRHKKYKTLLGVRDALRLLDIEIKELRNKLPKSNFNFEQVFIAKVKEKYPAIHEEIKQEVLKLREQAK